MKSRIALSIVVLVALSSLAQEAAKPEPAKRQPLHESLQKMYDSVKRNLVEAAEVMPEDQYGFKPTPDVRSFGEIVGHVASSQYFFCSSALSLANPNKVDFEKLKTKKELVDALNQSNTYCDDSYKSAAESTLDAPITFGGHPATKGYPLVYNIAHDNEHYGNLVTYLRLKGIVPPSTARAKAAAAK